MSATTSSSKAVDELRRLAHIASILIDGDQAQRIICDRSYYYLATPQPGHNHMTGDYYDVDHQLFQNMKKFLLRFQELTELPLHCGLWVRVKSAEKLLTAAVRTGRHQRLHGDKNHILVPSPPVQSCLDSGEITEMPADEKESEMTTVLAPIFDSLRKTVGVLEICTSPW